MASQPTHWVQELFPPTFGLTVDEVLTTEEKEDQRENVFEKLAAKISPLDVTSIKNVYERVWLMKYYEEEEKRKQLESDEDEECWDFRSSTPNVERARKPKTKTANTSTTDIEQCAPLNVADPCIWDSKEIEVLRRVFQTAQKQNIQLTARLHVSEYELHKVKSKQKKQCSSNASNIESLQTAVKANKRLEILSLNLKKQLEKANRDVGLLEKELNELREGRRESLKELHDIRVELDGERLEKKRLEIDLKNQNKEALREWHLREDNLKLLHQEEIGYMKKQITKLKEQLDLEKNQHHRTQNALEHLRTHFSRLPLAGDEKPRAVVTNDQLTKWTY